MSHRQNRIADEIRDLVANCFSGDRMNDPRLSGLTVTFVKVSPDLQIAKVYYRVFDQQKLREVKKGLEHCKGYLRKQLAVALRVRRVPELIFYYDESVETGEKVEKILDEIKSKK
jgi:ribosome-binding factor A